LFNVYTDVANAVDKMHKPLATAVSTKRTTSVKINQGDPISILLLGVDKRPDDPGRSDSMLVVTVNPKTNKTTIVSIPRDTKTKIISSMDTKKNDITKIIAYTLKDGNYFIHWDNSEQIDEAVKSILTFKEEENLKTLKEKVIYNMNKLEDIDTLQNTDLMFAILKWFKTRELAYPTQHWLKSTMVAFYMQNPTQNINLRNIETLYNIKNSWVENK